MNMMRGDSCGTACCLQPLTLNIVIGLVRKHRTRFESLEEAVGIRGVGEKTGLKVGETPSLLTAYSCPIRLWKSSTQAN